MVVVRVLPAARHGGPSVLAPGGGRVLLCHLPEHQPPQGPAPPWLRARKYPAVVRDHISSESRGVGQGRTAVYGTVANMLGGAMTGVIWSGRDVNSIWGGRDVG